MRQDDATQPVGTAQNDAPDATLVLAPGKESVTAGASADEIDQIDAPDFAHRFEFICNFAAGGMGRVAKARDIVFNRIVAVKRSRSRSTTIRMRSGRSSKSAG